MSDTEERKESSRGDSAGDSQGEERGSEMEEGAVVTKEAEQEPGMMMW